MTRDNNREPILNATHSKATPLNYGSGHVRPNRAMDPGLVYDLSVNDHLNFLCAMGYNATQILSFSETTPYSCPSKPINLVNFNYPSIAIPDFNGSVTVTRRVKNVGSGPSSYKARVRKPSGFAISVEPKVLKFDKVGEEKSFSVTFKSKKSSVRKDFVFGELIWSDNKHYVRSPIVVKW